MEQTCWGADPRVLLAGQDKAGCPNKESWDLGWRLQGGRLLEMVERGKYHGQRLKAHDVLRLYAVGERDFRGTILRGCNFRAADLPGADFSGADIRSARFVNMNLQEAKFCYVKAGLQKRCWLGHMLCVVILASLAGFMQRSIARELLFLQFRMTSEYGLKSLAISCSVVVISFFAIALQGSNIRSLITISIMVGISILAGSTNLLGDINLIPIDLFSNTYESKVFVGFKETRFMGANGSDYPEIFDLFKDDNILEEADVFQDREKLESLDARSSVMGIDDELVKEVRPVTSMFMVREKMAIILEPSISVAIVVSGATLAVFVCNYANTIANFPVVSIVGIFVLLGIFITADSILDISKIAIVATLITLLSIHVTRYSLRGYLEIRRVENRSCQSA